MKFYTGLLFTKNPVRNWYLSKNKHTLSPFYVFCLAFSWWRSSRLKHVVSYTLYNEKMVMLTKLPFINNQIKSTYFFRELE